MLLNRLAQQALASYMTGQPHLDHLPGSIYLHYLRSLVNNADVIELGVRWLDCNVISLFGHLETSQIPRLQGRHLPENLMVTAL